MCFDRCKEAGSPGMRRSLFAALLAFRALVIYPSVMVGWLMLSTALLGTPNLSSMLAENAYAWADAAVRDAPQGKAFATICTRSGTGMMAAMNPPKCSSLNRTITEAEFVKGFTESGYRLWLKLYLMAVGLSFLILLAMHFPHRDEHRGGREEA